MLTFVLGLLMVTALAVGRAVKRPWTPEGDRVRAGGSVVSLPVTAPAGVELLMIVR
jgi:hypothetical protein